jgi:uncharacterized protein YndB with AHSA1/START domain
MALTVCPTDIVHAPVESVWDLLSQPAGYGRFWDLTVERVEPEGGAVPGQRFVGWSRELGRRWRITGEIMEVDPARHQIRFRVSLPFGVVGDNQIGCTPIDQRSCTLRFG